MIDGIITSGPELQGKALKHFIDRRRTVNRYFLSLGYDISAMIKPFSFGPFGRDVQALDENSATATALPQIPLLRFFFGSFAAMPSPSAPATPC